MEIVISFCFARWLPRVDGAVFFSTHSDSDLHYRRHELFSLLSVYFLCHSFTLARFSYHPPPSLSLSSVPSPFLSLFFIFFSFFSAFLHPAILSLFLSSTVFLPLRITPANLSCYNVCEHHWVAGICLQQSASLKSPSFTHTYRQNKLFGLHNENENVTATHTPAKIKSQSCFVGINCLISKGFKPLSVGCADMWQTFGLVRCFSLCWALLSFICTTNFLLSVFVEYFCIFAS